MCLLRELGKLGCRFVLLTDKPLTREHLEPLDPRLYEVVLAPPMKYPAWEQLWLPHACRRHRTDLLHSPMNFGLPAVAPCPTVLTLHDAIDVAFAPTRHASLGQRLHRVSHWVARRTASKIITVSQHARRDIEQRLGVRAERIEVIAGAADLEALGTASEDDQPALEALGASGRFVLYAGGFEARKNVGLLLEAFLASPPSDVKLLLVGKALPDGLEQRARRSEGRVICTGYVSDQVLGALYRRALCFVYPSLYEGFGLQLCEAMSQGCPVLAADATSLPEVVGDGGELFNPNAPATLTALLSRLYHDAAHVEELRARARHRALSFSWEKTAAQTLALYASLS